MIQLWRQSPFVHLFERGASKCLYLATEIENIYFSSADLLCAWQSFSLPRPLPPAKTETGRFLHLLAEKRFIVRKEEDSVSALEQAARTKLGGGLRCLYLVPTVQCNLRCRYCHIIQAGVDRTGTPMDQATVDDAISLFAGLRGSTLRKPEMVFYGGEPFLAYDTLRYATRKAREVFGGQIDVAVFTNGTLIQPEMAAFLREHDVFVILSLDGPPAVNDMMRVYHDGAGSARLALRGYRTLLEAGCKVGISCVMAQHNAYALEQTARFLLSELKPMDLGLSTLHLFAGGENPHDVPAELISEQLIRVFEFARSQGHYVEHIFRRVRPFVEQAPRLVDCPSCGGKIVVTPSRRVGFCEAYMTSGRFFYPLNEFSLDSPGYREWSLRSPFLTPECHSCPAIGICGGGCPYDAEQTGGTISALDLRRCTQSLAWLEWMVWDLFAHVRASAEGNPFLIPRPEDRSKLYGATDLGPHRALPLQEYSRFGEVGQER